MWDIRIPGSWPCHTCNRPLGDGACMALEHTPSGLRRYHLRCTPDRCWLTALGQFPARTAAAVLPPPLQDLQQADSVRSQAELGLRYSFGRCADLAAHTVCCQMLMACSSVCRCTS